MSSPSPSLTDDEHDSYHPPGSPTASGSAHATTAKRGRKPAPGSRAAREALRKSNHSVIEKRRREKINETMAALRTLLADGYRPSHRSADAVNVDDGPKQGKKTQDFKLEVLTRSVEYINQLLDRISTLEQKLGNGGRDPNQLPAMASSSSAAQLGKRKRDAGDEGGAALPPPPPSTRLPSISSLLNPQLPSPPLTVPIRPAAHDIPPILTLPAARTHHKPPSPDSINWTPDEEHVASLLLNISSNRSESPTSPRSAHTYRARAPAPVSMTPAGMLGLRPASA